MKAMTLLVLHGSFDAAYPILRIRNAMGGQHHGRQNEPFGRRMLKRLVAVLITEDVVRWLDRRDGHGKDTCAEAQDSA